MRAAEQCGRVELTCMINRRSSQVDRGACSDATPNGVRVPFPAPVVVGLGFEPDLGHSGKSAASLTRPDGRNRAKRQRMELRLPARRATIWS